MGTRPGDLIAEELAALRRVAVQVAREAPPEEIFAAVASEAGRLLRADRAAVVRYDPDKGNMSVARWTTAAGDQEGGDPAALGERNLSDLVFETGQPTLVDNFSEASSRVTDVGRWIGIRSGVGAPITVQGRLWGAVIAMFLGEELMPAGTDARLAGFAELAGTAIANAQARVDLRGYAEEQAALRRVATLVAGGAPPEEVFAAVAAEVGRQLSADVTAVDRYDPAGLVMIVGAWSSEGVAMPASSVGTQISLGGQNVASLVFQTRRPARISDYDTATGAAAGVARDWGFRAAVGAPITAEGRLWGVMIAAFTRTAALPADTEARLGAFTELVGTAIANAEAQAALAASRARIVAAADEARRRIERDLHDGAQQRLVTLSLQAREVRAAVPPGSGELGQRLDGLATGLDAALEELREIARGIHPAVLIHGGLRPALNALVRRCPIPVDLQVQVAGRLPGPVETGAYYVVSEALTNTAKHAHAAIVMVEVGIGDGMLRVDVRDDGHGGADFGHGSGLIGLRDRVEALGGTIVLHSPAGKGTTLEVHIPVQQRRGFS